MQLSREVIRITWHKSFDKVSSLYTQKIGMGLCSLNQSIWMFFSVVNFIRHFTDLKLVSDMDQVCVWICQKIWNMKNNITGKSDKITLLTYVGNFFLWKSSFYSASENKKKMWNGVTVLCFCIFFVCYLIVHW